MAQPTKKKKKKTLVALIVLKIAIVNKSIISQWRPAKSKCKQLMQLDLRPRKTHVWTKLKQCRSRLTTSSSASSSGASSPLPSSWPWSSTLWGSGFEDRWREATTEEGLTDELWQSQVCTYYKALNCCLQPKVKDLGITWVVLVLVVILTKARSDLRPLVRMNSHTAKAKT